MKKILILMMIMSSCSQLTTKGRLVQVWTEMTPENSGDYREIGSVTCTSDIFMVTRNFNRKRCTEGLRNAASRLGGAAVVIEQEKKVERFLVFGVEIEATAYKYIR